MRTRKLRKGKRLHGYGREGEGWRQQRRGKEGGSVCRRKRVQTERKVRKEAVLPRCASSGEQLVGRKPYKKPTQVNERGMRKGLQRIILKELGQMTP